MTGHLIHIGFPKTGSNSLRRWFAAHPQLAYADGGIAGFQDVYSMARPPRDVRYRVTSYEGLAIPRRESRLAGPQAEVCAMLADLFPRARILIMTRGYRTMIVSSYSEYVRTGGEDDFAEFCDHILRSDNPWHYDRVLGLYESAFGAENVIVMPYEFLRDDPVAFTRALTDRLGIDAIAAQPQRVHAGLSAEEMVWYPRLSRVARRFPRPVQRAYARASYTNRLKHPIHVLQRVRPAAPVDADAIPEKLFDMLRPGAARLRELPRYAAYRTDYLG